MGGLDVFGVSVSARWIYSSIERSWPEKRSYRAGLRYVVGGAEICGASSSARRVKWYYATSTKLLDHGIIRAAELKTLVNSRCLCRPVS